MWWVNEAMKLSPETIQSFRAYVDSVEAWVLAYRNDWKTKFSLEDLVRMSDTRDIETRYVTDKAGVPISNIKAENKDHRCSAHILKSFLPRNWALWQINPNLLLHYRPLFSSCLLIGCKYRGVGTAHSSLRQCSNQCIPN